MILIRVYTNYYPIYSRLFSRYILSFCQNIFKRLEAKTSSDLVGIRQC